MKIILVNKIVGGAALVFLIRGKASIKDHPFFGELTPEGQAQLIAFDKKRGEEENFERSLYSKDKKMLILGVSENFTHRKAILAMRRVISAARKEKSKEILVNFEDFISNIWTSDIHNIDVNFGASDVLKIETLAEILATQLEIANFEFIQYKTPPKKGWNFVEETLIYANNPRVNTNKIQKALDRGKIIGEEINSARILSNTPGGDMTPLRLAEAAAKAGKRTGFKVKVLDEREMEELKMGGILGVARGSSEKPKFIFMEFMNGAKNEKPVVLVGKGVTFDTGGLNIKGEDRMNEMHMDMSGGASVIHTIAAAARIGIKKNIIGLVPAVENMPSGSSYRPGDMLRTMSGKTIEVLNTDAEGRIILADALTYAKRYKPKLVIDLATLTGAAIVALGQRASAIFSTDEKISRGMQIIGEVVGDYVWPLPLWEEYEEEIKGTFGDVANSGKTKYGGAVTGAVFLWQFIKDPSTSSGQVIPWIHLDIAPRMTAIDGEFLAKGSVGAGVALLTKFLAAL